MNPIDFSTISLKALRQAIACAKSSGGRVSLIHVIEPYMAYVEDGSLAPPVVDQELVRSSAMKKLQRLAGRMDPVIRGKQIVCFGKPFQEVANIAKRMRTDLIVLTTHGHTGWKHVFLGSTAERLVRHAPCPVLVVHGK